jgi:hypothetical protein
METYDVYFWKNGVVIDTATVKGYNFTSALIEAEAKFLFSQKNYDSVSINLRMSENTNK